MQLSSKRCSRRPRLWAWSFITVALNKDLRGRKLKRGEVGTVVEVLAPDVYEVEFCDEDGQTYAELALRGDQLIPLHNQGESLKIVA
jgi:hypothetical protein